MIEELSKEERQHIANLVDENEYGRLIISTHCINVYRKYSADYSSDNGIARLQISRIYNREMEV